jgi:hypothetical protein
MRRILFEDAMKEALEDALLDFFEAPDEMVRDAFEHRNDPKFEFVLRPKDPADPLDFKK